MAGGGKTILFVKKESLLPDFWIFKNLNEIYWNLILNFFVLRTIKKYKTKKLLIISDYQSKIELEKRGIKSETFGDYVGYYEQGKKYIEAKKLIGKWSKFDGIKRILNYKGMDLWYIFEEEFSWWLNSLLYQLSIIKRIIEKNSPNEIIINSKRSILGKCYRSVADKRGIKVGYFSPQIADYLMYIFGSLIKEYSLAARFHKLPHILRREFTKTGNLGKIKSKKNNILVAGLDKLHYSRMENIVKELVKSKENNVIILINKFYMQDELKKQGLDYVSFGDFLNRGMKKEINKKNKEIRNLWKQLSNDSNFHRFFRYEDENLWNVLKEEFDNTFSIKFKWIMYYIETTKTLLDKLKINLVATICDFMPPTRSLVMISNSKSIPTLLVQQGLQVNSTGQYFIPLNCKKMAIWGKEDKRYMEGFGIENNRLVVTGSSLHDMVSVKKINKDKRKEIFAKLKIDKNKKKILLASQAFEGIWGEKAREELIDVVVSKIKDLKDSQLIIKLHPREDEGISKEIIKKYNARNVIITKKEFDINDLISFSDVVITVNSTCIYDAILLNKPVIIVNLFKVPEQVQYAKSGACLGVYHKKDFDSALKMAYNKKLEKRFAEGRRKFMNNYFYKKDGKASIRTASLIKNMIQKTEK